MYSLSIGLLVVRGVGGLVMAAHAAQKLFGWFGGPGLAKTGEFFGYLGFQPGTAFAALASLAELTSGLLVAFGFLGPVGPALMASVMIVALITVHWQHGLFASDNGIEVPLLNITAATALVFTGYGVYSLDSWLGIADRWAAPLRLAIFAAGILGGLTALALRRRPTAPAGA